MAAFSPTPPGFLPDDSPAKWLCALPLRNLLTIPYISAGIAL
jgi:hypothetical protein